MKPEYKTMGTLAKTCVALFLASCVTFTGCGKTTPGALTPEAIPEADAGGIPESMQAADEDRISESLQAAEDAAMSGENATSEAITEEQALGAIRNYCLENNPDLKDMLGSEDYTLYFEVSTNEEGRIVVLYRSYTGAQVRYYIDPDSGETYVTEFVPGITEEEERTDETLNVKDHME